MKTDALARIHFEPDGTNDKRAHYTDKNSAPWLRGNVARGNRLRLSGPVGRGQPKTGGESAFVLEDALRSGARVRTGSR